MCYNNSMPPILSPWLAQLQERRPFLFEKDMRADVAVVGAGIAGMSTAAYILADTDLSVALVDAGCIAHGATGHNAGQLVADFERPLADMIDEYGLRAAVRAQTEVEGGWIGVDWLMQTFGLRTPLHRCQGFSGFTTPAQVRAHLDAAGLRARYGLHREPLLVAVGSAAETVVTAEDEHLLVRLPHSVILRLLHTDDPSFMAASTSPKGCMNSAHFCEELAGSLLARYPGRFSVAENMPVREVSLSGGGSVLRTDGPTVHAKSAVLCTNGFENIRIDNADGPEVDRSFHRMVQGVIGYMGGYLSPDGKAPAAISYFRENRDDLDPDNARYTYLTRRPYEHAGARRTLLCLGGPERLLPDGATYDRFGAFPADVDEEIDRAFATTWRSEDVAVAKRSFRWHGVMGYTPTGIRCVGRDPRADGLLYNLGCNGVGILPSIAGGRRIAQILAGAHLEESLFDPVVQMR